MLRCCRLGLRRIAMRSLKSRRFIRRICDRICHSAVPRERVSVHAADMVDSIADATGGQPLESCGSYPVPNVFAALMSAVWTPGATNQPLLSTTIATSPMNKPRGAGTAGII